MAPGDRRQPRHGSRQAGGVQDIQMPAQVNLTPSQMTALVVIEYGSGEAVEDARLEDALRRVRGRPDKSKAHLSVHLALGVLAAACLGLRVEGSISMEVGRQ